MDLYDYFYKTRKETGIEMRDFAKLFGVSSAYISTLIFFRRYPSFMMAQRIEKVTNGAVTTMELMQDRINQKKIPLNIGKSKNRRKKSESKKMEGEQMSLNLK